MLLHKTKNSGAGPDWRKSTRIEKVSSMDLNGSPQDIFPLLCPVLEYDWIPDWKCTMCWSDTGAAEKDCNFHTQEQLGRTAVWTCISYEPDTLIEYLVVNGKSVVMRLSLELEQKGPKKSILNWRMLFTLTSHLGKAVITRDFSEEKFTKFIKLREDQINKYLEYGAEFWKKE